MPQAIEAAQAPGSTPTVRARRASRLVNKSECCRHFGWSRAEFDKKAAEGMPVVEAAQHKGAEWRVNLAAVARWMRKVEEEEAERRRFYRERQAQRSKEIADAAARISASRFPAVRRLAVRLPRNW
jgi:phage terminase Nu1 subunit (DNA packaging protein)